jgi:predicted RNase H-like HicB family nuclease
MNRIEADVVIEKDEDGYYAYCPALEGCQSQGETLAEVWRNICEAIELYWETLTPHLMQSPRLPRNLSDH